MRRWLRRLAILLGAIALALVAVDWLCFQGSGFPPPHVAVFKGLPKRGPIPGRVALVVNGAIDPRKNHARYWNNTSLAYCTLTALGYEKVVVLQSDGRSPAPDRTTRSFMGVVGLGEPVDSALDLDGDGDGDVAGPATKAAMQDALQGLGQGLMAGDTLTVMLTDHGQLRLDGLSLRAVAMLWGAELTGAEFDGMLRAAVPPEVWVAVVATQCHSSLFLDEVTRERTVLMASGWPLWIWSTQDYSVFPYHFCQALVQRDLETGAFLAGDEDGDGVVTLGEAFATACRRDHAPEWPVRRIVGKMADIPTSFR